MSIPKNRLKFRKEKLNVSSTIPLIKTVGYKVWLAKITKLRLKNTSFLLSYNKIPFNILPSTILTSFYMKFLLVSKAIYEVSW